MAEYIWQHDRRYYYKQQKKYDPKLMHDTAVFFEGLCSILSFHSKGS